jgi:FkbM family methyltransferase
MDEVKKYRIYRLLKNIDIRLQRSSRYKFSYDPENYIELHSEKNLIIFDVGANIGQSSIWYAKSFPLATIYSFEPFPIIYERLQANTKRNKSIKSFPFALGNKEKKLDVPEVNDPLCQTAKVEKQEISKNQKTNTIMIKTIDQFCFENCIEKIHILKTDTEGYDLNVLKGAIRFLSEGKITNILTEASIIAEDKRHTNLFELTQFLTKFNFELFALYDLEHSQKNGKLKYFNALFKRK